MADKPTPAPRPDCPKCGGTGTIITRAGHLSLAGPCSCIRGSR